MSELRSQQRRSQRKVRGQGRNFAGCPARSVACPKPAVWRLQTLGVEVEVLVVGIRLVLFLLCLWRLFFPHPVEVRVAVFPTGLVERAAADFYLPDPFFPGHALGVRMHPLHPRGGGALELALDAIEALHNAYLGVRDAAIPRRTGWRRRLSVLVLAPSAAAMPCRTWRTRRQSMDLMGP